MTSRIVVALPFLLWSASATAAAQDLDREFRRHVREGRYSEAERLLANPSVDPNAQDGRGYTPLMFASERDQPELVTLLVKGGASLDLRNNAGETALILAVRKNRIEATRLLLMAGADVSVRDTKGRDALEWAREEGRRYIAQIISIASRPSFAKIILSEKPAVSESEHLAPPTAVEQTPPLYSEGAFERGIEGRVVLRVIIRKDGSMGPIRVHQSLDRELDRAAVAAVSTWRFAPATVDGVPINVLADIEVDFSLTSQI